MCIPVPLFYRLSETRGLNGVVGSDRLGNQSFTFFAEGKAHMASVDSKSETAQQQFARVGHKAPDFEVAAYDRRHDGDEAKMFPTLRLSDYKGKWRCLFFYPLDFTFVCPTEIVAFSNAIGEFEDRDCAVLTASTDSVYSHKGWCDSHPELKSLAYPMLADTGHELSRAYGVLDEKKGIAYRGVFLLDPDGIIRWLAIHVRGVGRNVDEVLRGLDALQTDKLCPCNWKKGDQTLD